MADCVSLPNAAELVEDLRNFINSKENDSSWVIKVLMKDTMLHAANAIEQLLAENAKLKAERDDWRQKYLSSEADATNLTGLLVQAVADLKTSSDCDFCKYNTNPYTCEKSPKGDRCMGKRWEWRGVQDA